MSWRTFLRWEFAITLLVAVPAAGAADDEAKALQEQLSILNQEQQAVYQQFQMIQQLRRANAEPLTPPIGGGPPGNYDDMVTNRQAQRERDEDYARELRYLYQQHQDLEQQKRPLLEQLRRLRASPPS
jgi:hypothetical protein